MKLQHLKAPGDRTVVPSENPDALLKDFRRTYSVHVTVSSYSLHGFLSLDIRYLTSRCLSVSRRRPSCTANKIVGRQGFEPWTPGLKVRCSDQAELTALNVGKLLYGSTHWLSMRCWRFGTSPLPLGGDDGGRRRAPTRDAPTGGGGRGWVPASARTTERDGRFANRPCGGWGAWRKERG